MSDSNATNVDLPALLGVVNELSGLSTSMGELLQRVQDTSDLSWTGADDSGTTLYRELLPAEDAGIQAVNDTQGAVKGIVDSLGTTANLWKNTENTNIELNG